MLPDLSRQKTTPVVGRATVLAVSVTLNTSLVSTQRIWTLPPGETPAAAAPVNANQTRRHRRWSTAGCGSPTRRAR